MTSCSLPPLLSMPGAGGKNVAALVQAVAADKPEVVVDLGDISRRLHELAENLKLIIDGTDEHYVYSLQVNRRLRAGGESMTAERIDIGEALANEWLPEVHTAIFASATMTVSKSFEHFNHAVGSIALALRHPRHYIWIRAMTSIRTWP